MERKEAEGIALLSMYNDEDMDVDDDDDDDHGDGGANDDGGVDDDDGDDGKNGDDLDGVDRSDDCVQSGMPGESLPLESPSPSPLLTMMPTPLPVTAAPDSDGRRTNSSGLAIVDYAHDENALSPEEEEGEILSTGRVVIGAELQVLQHANGSSQYWAPPGSVRILTPRMTETAESVSQTEEPKSDVDSNLKSSIAREPEADQNAEVAGMPVEEATKENIDPLQNFLPPPPTSKCSAELQAKIVKFLGLMNSGRSFNEELCNSKGYKNPDFLQHAVRYQEIDQLGTCFSKDVFDPYGYDKSDYYDEIEAEMKREMERKEQVKKKSQKIELSQGCLLPTPAVSAPKAQVTSAHPKCFICCCKFVLIPSSSYHW